MNNRFKPLIDAIKTILGKTLSGTGTVFIALKPVAGRIVLIGGLIGGGYLLVQHPPLQSVERGEVLVRSNLLTGDLEQFRQGSVLVLPRVHSVSRYPLRDQIYQPAQQDDTPFQSIEGLALGVDLTIRYALDPQAISKLATDGANDLTHDVVEPEVQGVIYRILSRYTVREIFSAKRAEIQQTIENELKPKLAANGIILRTVQMGKVALPEEYRVGMEQLLSEELASEKMRYTLELKGKQVKESALEAEAEKVRREKAAEASANEQIIAARAQEEAMKHVLPFKQKQIEQRQLEAEAEKVARIKGAEASSQARQIEANAEAASRTKLADAEVYRLEQIGKVSSAQMARDGELVTKHPLLIQKIMADKLSDKVSVIIAPPQTNAGLLTAALSANGMATGQSNMPVQNGEESQP